MGVIDGSWCVVGGWCMIGSWGMIYGWSGMVYSWCMGDDCWGMVQGWGVVGNSDWGDGLDNLNFTCGLGYNSVETIDWIGGVVYGTSAAIGLD